MTRSHPKRCPLCGGPADIHNFPECKHYRCGTCKEFVVQDSAIDHLPQEPEARRSHWAGLTSKGHGTDLLVISREPGTPARLDARFMPRQRALGLPR